MDEYLPIADHGLIGDLHTAALVGADGTIDWYCPERFDAPSVFAAVLDRRRGGFWELRPCDGAPADARGAGTAGARSGVSPRAGAGAWTSRQLYFPDTNVLITRFLSPDGVVEVDDFMPVGDDGGRITRPRDDRHGILRRVTCVRGRVRMRTRVEPRFDYGRARHETTLHERGAVFTPEGRPGTCADGMPHPTLALAAPPDRVPLTRTEHGVESEFELSAGDVITFALDTGPDAASSGGAAFRPRDCTDAATQRAFTATVGCWRRWLAHSRYTGRWREMVHRSALTLKLLTYAPTGAIVAAPTMGLPEQLGGERNWDYRYTWIRDAAFSLYALLRLGFTDEAAAFNDWLTDRFRDGHDARSAHPNGPLQIMYGIDGRTDLPETTLDHLEGYAGSAPVRIGNGAADQLQLDIYGELLDSLYLYNKYGTPLYAHTWDDVSKLVHWVCDNWDRADEGIWETRGGRRDFTYSRLMCWVAVERAIRVALQRGLPADLARWTGERDAIYRQIHERGWRDKREVAGTTLGPAFVQHYDTDVLDASVLLMPLVKFVSPTDPRWLATLDAVRDELVSDSLVYRYDPAASPDGLEGEEGTFSICSFWYVEALARAGRRDEARLAFEKMLTYANPVGLYAEEIGPSGEQLGNFPQAFTHLALISAAFNLDRGLGGRP